MRFFRTLRAAIAAGLIVAGLVLVGLGSPAIAQAQDSGAIFAQAIADSQITDDYEAPDRAIEGFGKVCDTGLAKACYNAGVMAERRFDSAIALGWMRKACEGGKVIACYYVADKLLYGDTPDQPAARGLFGKACAQGVPSACLRFGSMLESGEGGPEDMRKAFDVYKRACAAPSAVACDRLANFYRYREGFRTDDATARATLETACGLGAWSACSSLAEMLRDGQGGPADPARASDLFGKICLNGENMGACDAMLLTIDK